MEEWKEYKLGDFMEFNPKIKLAKDTLARKITMDQLIPHCRDIHSWTYEPYSGGAKFENGDTIMARITPCLENGKHAYVSCLDKGEVAYGSTEYIVIRGRKDISDNAFVYYLSHYPNFKNAAIKSMVGTSGRQRAQVDVLENLIMALPSLTEQRIIARCLKSLDGKIEVNRKINENLEQQAQALFKSWFVDFEPFKNGEFVESELGMIPKGWRVGTLGEIADINPSRALKKGDAATYLDMKNMPTSGPFPMCCESKVYTGGMRFQNKDTLMARITPCLENGKVAYVNFLEDKEIAFGSTEYIVMTSKNGFFPELLYFLCRDEDFKGYATKNMNGSSGRQRVSGETIGNYKIAIPPKALIESIASFYKGIMDNIKNNGFESRRLAELRDTLLPKLMSGELKVCDIVL